MHRAVLLGEVVIVLVPGVEVLHFLAVDRDAQEALRAGLGEKHVIVRTGDHDGDRLVGAEVEQQLLLLISEVPAVAVRLRLVDVELRLGKIVE